MFLTVPFRVDPYVTIPLYSELVRIKSIDVHGVGMVIHAEQSTEIQCAVAIALQEIAMMLSTRNGVETIKSIDFSELANRLILTARNGVESRIRISADNIERLSMMLTAHQTQPDLLIEEVKNAVLENNLVIIARDGVEIHPTIKMEIVDHQMVLNVADGIEISLLKTLEDINNFMEMSQSGNTGVTFEIGLLENDSGMIDLVLYASDDVDVIRTLHLTIGTIDPNKIGELDPYFIPDSKDL